MIVIEAQSVAWHFNEDAWRADMERTTNLGRMGWLVLQFTYKDLKERPEWVARTVAEALGARAELVLGSSHRK
jgi:very-short-patch-repair endonuclease